MDRPRDVPVPCDAQVVESAIRGTVFGTLWSVVDCLHTASWERAGRTSRGTSGFRQCARLAPTRVLHVAAFFSIYNGIQCVALRASVQPVGAAWAGGGAAGLATTVSTKNVPVVLFTSLTCATAAAGVAAITGRRK
ncbi:hypothetical protein BU14_1226s0003 [Porphyra umbilicalis]|uniref:Uncharacterized protein n=1 Tax=Porphyra umbilicalis TaxID=2786 RepID=A0A1X6NMD3_PORUM|nr:hypothetical protein BU14_1226s0003 [Porphyra umbilicalis]|eukprot:OSX69745.1 hypothetical protein BU14_1226s0003 [Porphyra umbilicalis]